MRYGSTFKLCGKLHPGRLCGAESLSGINSNYTIELCSSNCGLGLRPYSPSREFSMAVSPGDMSSIHLHPLLHFAGKHGML